MGFGTIIFTIPSWWFQPIWKICSSNWKSSPNRAENKKYIWNHRVGAVTPRQSNVSLVLGALHGIAKGNLKPPPRSILGEKSTPIFGSTPTCRVSRGYLHPTSRTPPSPESTTKPVKFGLLALDLTKPKRWGSRPQKTRSKVPYGFHESYCLFNRDPYNGLLYKTG